MRVSVVNLVNYAIDKILMTLHVKLTSALRCFAVVMLLFIMFYFSDFHYFHYLNWFMVNSIKLTWLWLYMTIQKHKMNHNSKLICYFEMLNWQTQISFCMEKVPKQKPCELKAIKKIHFPKTLILFTQLYWFCLKFLNYKWKYDETTIPKW